MSSNVQITQTESTKMTTDERLDRIEASLDSLSENIAELIDKLNDMELTAQYAGEGYSILEGQG